jgi:pimeloyl-ACP methyl ester carboxylesterase
MPRATIRGVSLNYEIVGDRGPAMALTPGGRSPLGNVRSLAQRMAAAGYRVLIHDRRNCGASDVSFDGSQAEFEVSADDLHALLNELGMLPAILGGASSGARLSLTVALRYRNDVRALILWRLTGGTFAVNRLVERYYDQFTRVAEQGGMAAVCATDDFAAAISAQPQNRERLMAMDPQDFIAVMLAWRRHFLAGAELPLIGLGEADLRRIAMPSCLVPGDDLTHPSETAAKAAALIPNSELHRITQTDQPVDVTPAEEWQAREGKLVEVFVRFLARTIPKH